MCDMHECDWIRGRYGVYNTLNNISYMYSTVPPVGMVMSGELVKPIFCM